MPGLFLLALFMLGIVKRDEHEFQSWLKKQHAKAAGILEGWGMDPDQLLSTEIGWLLCLPKYRGLELVFDMFQLGFLMSRAKMRSMNKARQVGFSFAIACESLARCHLKPSHTSVCVSYNLADAKEKIALVKELHEDLPLSYQKEIFTDSKTEVSFLAPGSRRKISRVISNPAKAPRGKSGDVYLDELAHCQNDKAIYAGATALIIRSGGQLTIGSTPLGQRGTFYEIHTQANDPYSGFERFNVPWWLCRQFSRISTEPNMIALCETLPTEIRVDRFGTQKIKDQFGILPIEDFQQEYELAFQDERVSFFPWDMITPCAQKEAFEIPVYDNLSQLADVAHKLGPLYLGFDVGRTIHPSELAVFEKIGTEYVTRYFETFRGVPFPKQEARLKQIGHILGQNWVRWRIDETGLGKHLAESLEAEFGTRRIRRVNFSMSTKEGLANNFKILLQEKNLVLPKRQDLIRQIHSIKQRITAAGNAIFDSERNKKHHADMFWACALAVYQQRKRRRSFAKVGVRMLGEDAEKRAAESTVKAQEPILEKIFNVTEKPTAGKETIEDLLIEVEKTTEELQAESKILLTVIKVWKRSGDEEKVREFQTKYNRLRQRIFRRKIKRPSS